MPEDEQKEPNGVGYCQIPTVGCAIEAGWSGGGEDMELVKNQRFLRAAIGLA